MKQNNPNAKQSLYDRLQNLSFPVGGDLAQIQILDNREVLVECCKGILRYDENLIQIQAGSRVLTFTGLHLRMQSFSVSGLMIRGELHGIEFSTGSDAVER